MVRIKAIAGLKDDIKWIATEAAKVGADVMRAGAPRKSGQLAARIDWTEARFHLGGAGGGGFWEANAGVRSEPGNNYPTHVFTGTGIYGPYGTPVVPATGNILVLNDYKSRDMVSGVAGKARPGPIYTRHVKGQRPQTEWVHDANDAAAHFVAVRLSSIT